MMLTRLSRRRAGTVASPGELQDAVPSAARPAGDRADSPWRGGLDLMGRALSPQARWFAFGFLTEARASFVSPTGIRAPPDYTWLRTDLNRGRTRHYSGLERSCRRMR